MFQDISRDDRQLLGFVLWWQSADSAYLSKCFSTVEMSPQVIDFEAGGD
jgi:hypothetical protein